MIHCIARYIQSVFHSETSSGSHNNSALYYLLVLLQNLCVRCTMLCSNTNLHCTRLTGGQIPHCNGCGWHWSTPTTSFSATFAFTEATFAFPLTAPQIAIKGMVNYQSSVVHSPSHWIDIIWKVFVCLQTILSAKNTFDQRVFPAAWQNNMFTLLVCMSRSK